MWGLFSYFSSYEGHFSLCGGGAFLSLWLALFGLASLPTKIFTGAHDPTPYTNRQIGDIPGE